MINIYFILDLSAVDFAAGSTSCNGWRQTKDCNPDGRREPENDKDCFTEIKVGWSGFCDCKDGRKMMKHGCDQGCGKNCDTACKTGVQECSKLYLSTYCQSN